MNNTDRLLRAFIEASGYEIEEIPKTDTVIDFKGGIDWLGYYPTSKTVTTIDYKVTKKHEFKSKHTHKWEGSYNETKTKGKG